MTDMREVNSGEPLSIPAETYNAFIRATRRVEEMQRSLSREIKRDGRDAGIVRVKNNSGQDLLTYSVLGIDGPIFDPLSHFEGWRQEVYLSCSAPYADQHSKKYVVLAEPLKAGQTGRAWASSIAPVRIKADTVDYATCADPIAGNTDYVEGGSVGFPIIWVADENYPPDPYRWALIRMSSDCGAAAITDTDTTGCCAGCRCYPNDYIKVTSCSAVPCLYPEYFVIGDLPFINYGLMVHAGGCTFTSDDFDVVICDEDYGTATWTLEINAAVHESTLTLVVTGAYGNPGFTVVYKSTWFFDAICGNNFRKVFDCGIPPQVAHLFPCEVCVVANGDICEPCPAEATCPCPEWVADTSTIPPVLTGMITSPFNVTFPMYFVGTLTPLNLQYSGDFTDPTLECTVSPPDPLGDYNVTLGCDGNNRFEVNMGRRGSNAPGCINCAVVGAILDVTKCVPFEGTVSAPVLNAAGTPCPWGDTIDFSIVQPI